MKIGRVVGAVLIFVVAAWFFYFRSAAPSVSPRISWRDGGSRPFSISVHVTRRGQPVSNYQIGAENWYGRGSANIQATTDEHGKAVLAMGDSPMWDTPKALYCDGRRISLRPVPFGDYFLPCACHDGLTVDIKL